MPHQTEGCQAPAFNWGSSGDYVGSNVVAGSWNDLICWDWAVGI